MKKLFLTLSSICIGLLLGACSGNPHDKYLGYWQLEDSKYPKIMRIYKEDRKTYLVQENILNSKDFFGNKPKEQVLTPDGEQLGIDLGIGVVKFNLSEDGNTLRIEKNKYTRMKDSEAETIKAEAEKNAQLCQAAKEEYDSQIKAIQESGSSSQEQYAQRQRVRNEFKEKFKAIPACSAFIF